MGLLDIVPWWKGEEFKGLSEKDREYRIMLAATAHAMDGRLDDREKADYEQFRKDCPGALALPESGGKLLRDVSFSVIQRRHRALDWTKDRKASLAQWIRQRVTVDGDLAHEEAAFLIQMGQVLNEGEHVPLFLGADGSASKVEHDLFQYITEKRFHEEFPRSKCPFTKGTLYTPHPFLGAALVPFTEQGLQVAQLDTLRGVAALVQELGAKRVTIKHGTDFSAAVGVSVANNVGIGETAASRLLSVNGDVTRNDSEALECEFEGRVPLFAKWLPWFWKRQMLKRHAGCEKYLEIIEARLSDNPEKFRKHIISSNRSAKLAFSLASAIKYENVDASQKSEAGMSGATALQEEVLVEY